MVSLHSHRIVTMIVTKVKVNTNPEKLNKHHLTGKAGEQGLRVLEESVQKALTKSFASFKMCASPAIKYHPV